ncbi:MULTISPECIES: hypothetical protein [Pirellulaceae]|uniref:Uncharacterized protein n=1 Tax=Aporhodopirellula rubra TaxID=980271 RepID=A0A7W5DZY7_9BACT|nr:MULTISPECIES: hypothetical protein [Pirellulaceae]EMI45811.1 signal peptide protein [Rhodopirellula sp. SWK7]MBB3207601.1 hypothetical protein [Aporhodopirellula rubra]
MRLKTIRKIRNSLLVSLIAVGAVASSADAGSPWGGPWPWSKYEGSRRIDVIGPIGNRLPESYRRQYNRPTYLGGKLAAKIEPSSQEAMAFHRAEELGLYDNNGVKGALAGKHCPPKRVEQHYFYPKPWEVLAVGPRKNPKPVTDERDGDVELLPQPELRSLDNALEFDDAEMLELPGPVLIDPIGSDLELPTPAGQTE